MSSNVAAEVSGVGSRDDEQIELHRVECILTESLFKRILRRVFPDQRKQQRQPLPPLVGYLGATNASKPYDLGDISLSGFCLLTNERWIPGTEMPVTLRRMNLLPEEELDCFTVQATVVRSGENGVGFSIVLSEEESNAAYGNSLRVRWVTRAEMEQFLHRLKGQPGVKGISVEGPAESSRAPARAGGKLKAAFEGGH